MPRRRGHVRIAVERIGTQDVVDFPNLAGQPVTDAVKLIALAPTGSSGNFQIVGGGSAPENCQDRIVAHGPHKVMQFMR
jgi:hypothetical protein